MSGLRDAHEYLTWNGGELNALGELGIAEHALLTAQNMKSYLDSGYTIEERWRFSAGNHSLWPILHVTYLFSRFHHSTVANLRGYTRANL